MPLHSPYSPLSTSDLVSGHYHSKVFCWCVLLIHLSVVSSQSSILTKSCDPKVVNSCPLPSTICNKKLELCECASDYPIPLYTARKCVNYRSLGEECLISKQCEAVPNALCLTSDGKEIRENILRPRKSTKNKGHCRCRSGYRRSLTNACDLISVDQFACSGSHQCLSLDLNTHCDSVSKRCFCDTGFIYDTDKGQCVIHIKKFGQMCRRNEECENWDRNMECLNGVCLCKKRYALNGNSWCNLVVESKSLSHPCEYGLKWDQSVNECRPMPLYDVRTGEYRFFSVDKLLETIVIVIFCFVTIAFIRFWRYILPQNIIAESQTGIFSDFSHANRVQRRRSNRSNSVSCARIVRLRLNLDSPQPNQSCLSEEAFVALPLTSSQSSLPPYDSAQVNTQMTSYSDEPPTYEEAMALSLQNKK